VLLITIFGFVITPIMNTAIRTQEYEADMYGLNTSRQPDGFAQAAIHLGEYRKMNPGPSKNGFSLITPAPQPHLCRDALESRESEVVYGAATRGKRGSRTARKRRQEISALS